MQKQLINELGAGIRRCRVCQAEFIGRGALCPIHAAELAEQQRIAAQKANASLDMRIAKQRAERQARARREWVEAV